MPRLVVPILVPRALADSRWASSSRCRDRMSGTFSAMVGIEHHTVADHRQLAGADDAGRQQRQLEHPSVDHQRVAGVVAALEANDDVGSDRQPVDDLALPFVAPLGADHNHVRH